MIELVVHHAEIEFGQLIGCGSFGSVYQGKWKGKDVALKQIDVPLDMDKEQVIDTSHELQALRYRGTSFLQVIM